MPRPFQSLWRFGAACLVVSLVSCGGGGGGAGIDPFWVRGGVVAADLNGDGRLDVAVAAAYVDGPPPHAGYAEVFLGGANGGFDVPVRYPVGPDPWGLSVADVDGDGRLDLIAATPSTQPAEVGAVVDSGRVAVLRQDPLTPGRFLAAREMHTGGAATKAVVADATGDGLADLIVADGVLANGRLLLLEQAPGGSFLDPMPQSVAAGWGSEDATVADVDGDGRPDVVLAAAEGVAVFHRLPLGGFAPAVLVPAAGRVVGVAAADLDGDGRMDIAAAATSGSVTILRQTVAGQFVATTHAVAEGARRVAIGDLNADGIPDVAAVSLVYADLDRPAQVSVLLQSVTQRGEFAVTRYAGSANSDFVTIADVDGDGRNDLLLDDGPVFLAQSALVPGTFAPVQPLR